MQFDKLNQWLMLAANLGVIAGIAFLALEVSQNTEALQAQSSYNLYQAKTGSFRMIAQNPDGLADIFIRMQQNETLTPAETLRLRLYTQAMLGDFEWQYKEMASGRLVVDFDFAGQLAGFLNGMPYMMQGFERGKATNTLDAGFVEYVDAEVMPLVEKTPRQGR